MMTIDGLMMMDEMEVRNVLDHVAWAHYELQDFKRGDLVYLHFDVLFANNEISSMCELTNVDSEWIGTIYGQETINRFLHDCFLARNK